MELFEYVRQQATESLVTCNGAKIRQIKVGTDIREEDIKKGGTKLVNVSLSLIGSYETSKKEFEEKYLLPVKVRYILCPACHKAKSTYFESVLQLRNPSKEAIEFIENYVAKQRDRMNITKKDVVRNGLDFYLTERKAGPKLARLVSENFGGEVKVAEKLFSIDHQTGKEVYRVNALVRLPDFKVGDVLIIENRIIKITSLGPKLTGQNLSNGKSDHFDYSALEYSPVETFEAVVSKTYPELEIIHPETYQSVKVKNTAKVSKKKVRVAVMGDDVWLVE